MPRLLMLSLPSASVSPNGWGSSKLTLWLLPPVKPGRRANVDRTPTRLDERCWNGPSSMPPLVGGLKADAVLFALRIAHPFIPPFLSSCPGVA